MTDAVPQEPPDERKKREAKERKEAEERARAAKAEAAASQTAAASGAIAPAEPAPDALPLERAVFRRFVLEVVRPTLADEIPHDPVTRRGVALVVAGAAAGLARTAKTSETGRRQLIEEALITLGSTQESAAAFVLQHDALVAVSANAALFNIGRSALSKYLEGADVAGVLSAALAGWRSPLGQTGSSTHGHAAATAQPQATNRRFFVLTELRMENNIATLDGPLDAIADALRDEAMGSHNSVARGALSAHGGHEVKHTGRGILAQFNEENAAISAATEIRRRFTTGDGPTVAIAVVADTRGEDPLLSPSVIHRAQAVAAQAGDGEILVEQRVWNVATGSASALAEDEGLTLVRVPSAPRGEDPLPEPDATRPLTEPAQMSVPFSPATAAQTVNVP